MPVGARRRHHFFDVSLQDMVLRVSGPDDRYEEVRASAMQVWEQIQSYVIRDPEFRTSKRPVEVPADAPPIVQRMARAAASARVGPSFTLHGAVVDAVGRAMARRQSEVTVSCAGDTFVVARRRSRLAVQPPRTDGASGLAVVITPGLGPVGVYTTMRDWQRLPDGADGLAVVADSCMLADAAVAGAGAILARPCSFRRALSYLQAIPGVHGAIVLKGDRIGLAGALELAE